MRAEFPAHPVPYSNVIMLDVAAPRRTPPRNSALSWRTCLGAWVGLSAASWAIVALLAIRFA